MTRSVATVRDGDTVKLAVDLPADGVEHVAPDVYRAMLDIETWRTIARQIRVAADAADRNSDPERVAARVKTTLDQVVAHNLAQKIDAVVARSRAVSGLLHRLGDMVGTGTLRTFDVRWPAATTVRVTAETHGRAEISLQWDLSEAGA